MARHRLKTWPEPYQAVCAGVKLYEYRLDDRRFNVGDVLELAEWDPLTESFTGMQTDRRVTYITRGPAFGIPRGFCVMSLALVEALAAV